MIFDVNKKHTWNLGNI